MGRFTAQLFASSSFRRANIYGRNRVENEPVSNRIESNRIGIPGGSKSDLKWQSALGTATHVSGMWSCPDNRSKFGMPFRGLAYLEIRALRTIASERYKIYMEGFLPCTPLFQKKKLTLK